MLRRGPNHALVGLGIETVGLFTYCVHRETFTCYKSTFKVRVYYIINVAQALHNLYIVTVEQVFFLLWAHASCDNAIDAA